MDPTLQAKIDEAKANGYSDEEINAYINSQNYFGDEYHDALAVQQNNSDKWISNNLMLSAKDYKDLQKIKQNNLNKSLSDFKSFVMSKIKINL